MTIDVIGDLTRVFVGGIPSDVAKSEVGADVVNALATMFAMVENEVSRFARQSRIATASGLYLDLHARDRGLRRQDGETDDQLRERLRRPPLGGTVPAITEAVQEIIGDEGTVFVIEIPNQGMFFDRYSFIGNPTSTGFNGVSPFSGIFRNRLGGGRGVVVVLIPASAGALASVTDAVRSKVSAGKIWLVQEYA